MANDETSKVDEQMLHRLADGDLSAAEREQLEAMMTEADRARVNGIRRVGDLVRLASQEASSKLDSSKLFADIEAGIAAQEEAGFGGAFRVIEGGGGAAHVEDAGERSSRAPSQVRPEGWKIVVPVATGLLAAAVVLLVVLSGQRGVEHKNAGAQAHPNVETVIETPAGNEVIDVDLGQNAGTVFAVQGDAGEPLAVIWIEDEEVPGPSTTEEEGSSI